MPRPLRPIDDGLVYHVINRGNNRQAVLFEKGDYLAFLKALGDLQEPTKFELYGYCLMRNHRHLVIWPKEDGELTAFMRWLSHTHAMRWHVSHGTVALRGHLYQGRFKSFPVQEDEHFLAVCRYVERNALAAQVVERAEDWQSAHRPSAGPRGRLPGLPEGDAIIAVAFVEEVHAAQVAVGRGE